MSLELFGNGFQLTFLREMLIAYVLALPIAFDREHTNRSAGLRTFPIVSLACCSYILIACDMFGDDPQSVARVLYGLMTGIGFIGGGAIIKQGGTAHGTATAASIWGTGAIGASVAFHYYGIALAISILTFLTLVVFKPIKTILRNGSNPRVPRARERDDKKKS